MRFLIELNKILFHKTWLPDQVFNIMVNLKNLILFYYKYWFYGEVSGSDKCNQNVFRIWVYMGLIKIAPASSTYSMDQFNHCSKPICPEDFLFSNGPITTNKKTGKGQKETRVIIPMRYHELSVLPLTPA